MTDMAQDPSFWNTKKQISGSIVGFDGKVWFRPLKSDKCMTLLNRARQDGCGQPCIMEYQEYEESDG
jgi:hypothetical protein